MTDTNPKIERPQENKLIDGVLALGLFVVVVIVAYFVGESMSSGDVEVWHVVVAASITAIATGFGALPFLFVDDISDQWLGIGNALAAGLMLGASIGLVIEAVTVEDVDQPALRMIVGLLLGAVLVFTAQKLLENRDQDFHIGQIQGASAVQMLLIVGVMTVHSFAEGIGVGVSYGDGSTFGVFISAAIAVHNIPEGLAISLVLIPRGTSVFRSALWSMFTSIPQPIMAVPAFLFVLVFRPLLPVGLGLAAGAMFWMVFRELLPEAVEVVEERVVYPIMSIAVIGMLAFQFLI